MPRLKDDKLISTGSTCPREICAARKSDLCRSDVHRFHCCSDMNLFFCIVRPFLPIPTLGLVTQGFIQVASRFCGQGKTTGAKRATFAPPSPAFPGYFFFILQKR